MPNRAPERLTNRCNATEHKHDTLPWDIVAEHGSKTASSSDFPWQTTHKPSTNCPEANAHNWSSLLTQAPREEQLRLPNMSPQLTPRSQLSAPISPSPSLANSSRVSSLPSHVPDVAAPTSRCKTHLHASTRR